MIRLGERIRNRREKLNIQINDLANSIGVTPSLISQIERAKAFPSIVTLKKIADALQITVGTLIGENETFSKNPVVIFNEKKIVNSNESGASLYLLSNHDQQKLMEPHLFVFAPESNSQGLVNSISGQSYYFALKGNFRIQVNQNEFILNQNDSFYFNSGTNHTIHNMDKTEAQLLWVSTNPIM